MTNSKTLSQRMLEAVNGDGVNSSMVREWAAEVAALTGFEEPGMPKGVTHEPDCDWRDRNEGCSCGAREAYRLAAEPSVMQEYHNIDDVAEIRRLRGLLRDQTSVTSPEPEANQPRYTREDVEAICAMVVAGIPVTEAFAKGKTLCPHCGKSEPHTHRLPGMAEPVVFPHS